MARLKTDLVDVLLAATDSGQGLADMQLEWDRRIALGVVLAAAGYPDKPRAGDAGAV
jgi:phosphoribosylamine--glycine ligase